MEQKISRQDLFTLKKYAALSGRIQKWIITRRFLQTEFHQKKCVKKRTLYHVQNSEAKKVYDKILYFTQKGNSSLDTFPSTFQSLAEDAMYHELQNRQWPNGLRLTNIFYNVECEKICIPEVQQIRQENMYFDPDKWKLSEDSPLTEIDIKIIQNFVTGITSVMNDVLCVIDNIPALQSRAKQLEKYVCFLKKRFEKAGL